VFGNLPSHWTVVGAAIVIASGLYLLYRERKVTGRVEPVEPGCQNGAAPPDTGNRLRPVQGSAKEPPCWTKPPPNPP
jgi:hypothetical protein